MARPLALGALAIAVVVLIVIALSGGGAHHYRVIFDDAGQLVPGDAVRIGGTVAGSVEGIDLTDDGRASVRISVDDDFAPLRRGTTATVRWQGLIGVANRYVDVSPAPTFKPPLPENGAITADKTTSTVEIDQLFDALDAKTEKGLRRLIKGSAQWYEGRERQANSSAAYFSPALVATTRLFGEIDRDSAALEQLLDKSGKVFHALTRNRGQLTDLVSNTHATMNAIATKNVALSQALHELPGALREGSDAFAALRATLPSLRHLVDVTGPATKNLAPFLRRLAPIMGKAVPVFANLRRMFDLPGPNNDLYDALVDLPPLAKLVTRDFPQAEQALKRSTPIFSFIRPYVPDLVSFIGNFGAAAAPYDANGHYVRTLPVFNAYSFSDDAQGGELSPTPPADRGTSANLSTNNLRRCPGGAAQAPDGSGSWVDKGALSNADCDPSESVGAGR